MLHPLIPGLSRVSSSGTRPSVGTGIACMSLSRTGSRGRSHRPPGTPWLLPRLLTSAGIRSQTTLTRTRLLWRLGRQPMLQRASLRPCWISLARVENLRRLRTRRAERHLQNPSAQFRSRRLRTKWSSRTRSRDVRRSASQVVSLSARLVNHRQSQRMMPVSRCLGLSSGKTFVRIIVRRCWGLQVL
jgi:hypothetical protein